jgi:hypothetical protein
MYCDFNGKILSFLNRLGQGSLLLHPIIILITNLDNNMSWLTQSNAFSRSQKMPPTINLLFKVFKILLVNV